jgi:stearoyl-CoA desaturase (delta-9 desaturase)
MSKHLTIYNVTGAAVLVAYALAAALLAPAEMGPWRGLVIGEIYLILSWFLCGLYLADVIHLGIAHRSLDYKTWFLQGVTLLNNTVGLYVNPVTWVNRHRLHHKYSDHEGDPNKLAKDGLWRTLWLCVFPYPTKQNVAHDAILKTWPIRLVSQPYSAAVGFLISYSLISLIVGDWVYGAVLWFGVRVFALWVNMVQNYWAHDRRYGFRRYDDLDDHAMNISHRFPVTATFSACWQNNHHRYPQLERLSHTDDEYDFGFITVGWMKAMGLVKATETGAAGHPSQMSRKPRASRLDAGEATAAGPEGW